MLTTRSPASMAAGSSVAQYFPSRYSRTKTGTLAPTLTLRTRSLRTTFPAKTCVDFWSRSDMAVTAQSDGGHFDLVHASEFRPARGVQEADADRLLPDLLDIDHQGHGVGLDLPGRPWRKLEVARRPWPARSRRRR